MTRGSLTIAVDLPAVEEAERLLRACLLPLRPLGIAVTGSDALLRRLAVTVRQEPKTYLIGRMSFEAGRMVASKVVIPRSIRAGLSRG